MEPADSRIVLSPTTIRCKRSLACSYNDTPRHILFVCKPNAQAVSLFLAELFRLFIELAADQDNDYRLYIEQDLVSESQLADSPLSPFITCPSQSLWNLGNGVTLHLWQQGLGALDLIVTLGGDGTVLHAVWGFQARPVPPILPVYVSGTLGFLTVFNNTTCIELIRNWISDCKSDFICCHKRMRLRCCIKRKETLEQQVFHVLNEVVVDRGPCPYMMKLEVYGDDNLLTTCHSDGLIIATPTGSTAYSMSAGGSIVDPAIPAMLITPICSHSLSFRPIHVRDSMELTIKVPEDSRHDAWASFDGRHRVELKRGDSIVVTVSNYPVTMLCDKNQTQEWFKSLSRCLGWNERGRVG